jgi:hypothetical protein
MNVLFCDSILALVITFDFLLPEMLGMGHHISEQSIGERRLTQRENRDPN